MGRAATVIYYYDLGFLIIIMMKSFIMESSTEARGHRNSNERKRKMTHIAKLTEDQYGDPMFVFVSVDEDGEEWPLGSATLRIQEEGTEDEMRWFDGYYDTKHVAFDNAKQLQNWGKRHGYRIELE